MKTAIILVFLSINNNQTVESEKYRPSLSLRLPSDSEYVSSLKDPKYHNNDLLEREE